MKLAPKRGDADRQCLGLASRPVCVGKLGAEIGEVAVQPLHCRYGPIRPTALGDDGLTQGAGLAILR